MSSPIDNYEQTERSKRIFRKRFESFPKISFVVYIIFAIANALLITYLLFQNYNNDENVLNFIIIWGVFLLSIILFIINSIMFFFEFPYKKIILAISIIIQTILTAASLILANIYGHISPGQQLYVFMSHAVNILTAIISFVPLYFVY